MEFFTKTSELLQKSRRGACSKLKVEIFQMDEEAEKKVGEYERNYPSMYKTFFPFKRGEKWYALYSKDYQQTRVMELPSCRDIASEKSEFCPVEYYVPSYEDMYSPQDDDKWNNQFKEVEGTFGFVAGCYWGDDSSWKISFLDLKDMDTGNIDLIHKFGYISKPPGLSLKECVNLEGYAPSYNEHSIHIAYGHHFHLNREYLVGYPITIEGKSTEEMKSLPLYHDVDLNSLKKNELIKVILKQERDMKNQMGRVFHLHNLKNAIRNKFGEKAAEEIIKKSEPSAI